MQRIYLDFNATTPLEPEALAATTRAMAFVGNAASDHWAGAQAAATVADARDQVAALVGARPGEVIFTSGATEANNLAVLGTLATAPGDAEVIVSAIEHPAVLEAARHWGERCRVVEVDGQGRVDPDRVRALLSSRTALVSVMAANNETGVIQPTEDLQALCEQYGVPLHVDAVQLPGRDDLSSLRRVSALSLSGHKMGGPQGVGALVLRRQAQRLRLTPRQVGGGQELGRRSGTTPVALIAGFGAAARVTRLRERPREALLACRRLFVDELEEHLSADALEFHSSGAPQLAQTVSVRFKGVNARALLSLVSDHVAISTGSACSSTSVEPSHVLLAQGLSAEQASETLRISFGASTTDEELRTGASVLAAAARRALEFRGAQRAPTPLPAGG